MANARPDEKNPTQPNRETLRRTSETMERTARNAVEVGERVANAGADIMQRNAKAAQQTLQTGSDIASRIGERTADQFTHMLGVTGQETQRAVEQSAHNFWAVMQSGAILAEGAQNISREWMDFVGDRFEHGFDHMNELLRCRNPQQFAVIQTDLVRSNLERLLQTTNKIGELVAQVSNHATRKMSENAEKMQKAA